MKKLNAGKRLYLKIKLTQYNVLQIKNIHLPGANMYQAGFMMPQKVYFVFSR